MEFLCANARNALTQAATSEREVFNTICILLYCYTNIITIYYIKKKEYYRYSGTHTIKAMSSTTRRRRSRGQVSDVARVKISSFRAWDFFFFFFLQERVSSTSVFSREILFPRWYGTRVQISTRLGVAGTEKGAINQVLPSNCIDTFSKQMRCNFNFLLAKVKCRFSLIILEGTRELSAVARWILFALIMSDPKGSSARS